MQPPKIDKSHGFMQSILKNQVLRDEYDKEQKTVGNTQQNEERLSDEQSEPVQAKKSKTPRNISRRAAKELYVPPHVKKRSLDEQGEANESPAVKQELKRPRRNKSQKASRLLFKFEYQNESGEVKSILVKEDDNAEDLAETFGNQLGLTKSLRIALKHKLEMEIMTCLESS